MTCHAILRVLCMRLIAGDIGELLELELELEYMVLLCHLVCVV